MDRFSALPKIILHDILVRLPVKDAAKTSVLSKAWNDTWFSFPNLSVCSEDFFSEDDVPAGNRQRFRKLDILINYVTKRLLRLRDQGLAIKKFKLDLQNLDDLTHVSHHVDQWIQMACESGVQVLELYLNDDCVRWYELPLCVIEAKSLIELELLGGIKIDQELLKHSMKFSSVKMLFLSRVLFTHESAIEYLISHCPLTERFIMGVCYIYNHLSTEHLPADRIEKVESLSLQSLQKLKKVDVEGIPEVHIDSPNLEELCYQAWDLNAPFKLNFDSCTNLRCLQLIDLKSTGCTAIADKWFLELFSKFPFIENLKLFNCSMSERINISSPQLKILQLRFCSKLKKVNVDAPNLLLFDYSGDDKPVISFMRSSNQLEVNISTNVDFRHFYSLREFTRNMPQVILASLSLSIGHSFPDDDPYMPALLVSSTTPPSIKHLVLREYSPPDSEALYSQLLMNYLLSNCFPKTISFIYHRRFSFIEFFYEKLMGSEKGECYCSSGDRKCWWHALKIVSISCSFMTDENADFKAMLDASARSFEEKTITFSLEL
ncbi:F-box/FBD/LRR-repeat protein At1g78750 [Arachis ipaensis]|uniref:F-box/FBD/LRR-repeat protein At1g78750 n=1 Tax=Arachis ipaensis TaxID=130454 RepID=UPI000A2AF209|nr:F-box/FBD/LRR-repeat protein At1g78750 [Arachis ipaensis]